MGVEAAIIGSALIGAGGSAVAAHRQQRAQDQIARQQLAQREELSRRQRVAEVGRVEGERQSNTMRNRLQAAGAQQLQNKALAQRGIQGRDFGSFRGISQNVLDEGANV